MSLGATDYLPKPFHPYELATRIKATLGLAQ
jgi:DNA-binding response OmpR family regulator